MATKNVQMTILESTFHDAMRDATASARIAVSEIAIGHKKTVETACRLALREVPPDRMKTLAEFLAFQALTLIPDNASRLYKSALGRGDANATANWLLKYAPDAFKLIAREIMYDHENDIERVNRLHTEIDNARSGAHEAGKRRLFLVLGIRGEELDRLMGSSEMHAILFEIHTE